MMNDDLAPVRKWRIGELSIGLHSHEDVLALAQSFPQTELFLDAVEDILKRVDVVFGLRPVSRDGNLSFLDPPPHRNEVALICSFDSFIFHACFGRVERLRVKYCHATVRLRVQSLQSANSRGFCATDHADGDEFYRNPAPHAIGGGTAKYGCRHGFR